LKKKAQTEQNGEEEVVTWEKVMRSMRDPLVADDEAKAALEAWYTGVITSTGEDASGKSIDHADDFGWSFMFMCAYYNRPRCLVKLLLLGANPDVRLSATQRTPLDVAVEENRFSSVKVLEQAKNEAQIKYWDDNPDKMPRERFYKDPDEKPKPKKAPTKRSAAAAAMLAGPEESFEDMANALFDKFDSDKSGHIDATEVRGIFHELKLTISEDEVDALIVTYDDDKSGMLEKAEFMKMAQEANLGTARFGHKCKECFAKNDADKSGGIDVDELAAAFVDLRLDVTREEIEALVDQYDVDGSGELDESEFTALCRDAKEGYMATADDSVVEGGTWTKKEHEFFIRGMKMYGENWRKVAAHVKTRTAVQTRAHFRLLESRRKQQEGIEDEEKKEQRARIEAIEGAKHSRGRIQQEEAEQRAKDEEERKLQDEEKRAGKRQEAIHDTIHEAIRTVFGRTFEPEDILSWEQEEGFKHYLREYNVKTGTRRPASPRTRERLRKEFFKDYKVYYAKLKPLKKSLYTQFLSEEFTSKRVWSLKPAEGVEAKCTVGPPTQFEVAECLMAYGYGKKWSQYVFPGSKPYLKDVPGDEIKKPFKKNEDPWHNVWEMKEIDRRLLEMEMEAEEAREQERAELHGER